MVPEETNFQFKRRKPPYFGISARKRQKMPTPPTRKRGNSEPPGDQGLLRTRSYTLNAWMNSSQDAGLPGGWDPSHFKSMPQKLAQIVHPPPSGTFVFIDEHEETIDDGLWN